MKFILFLSEFMIPLVIFYIVAYGLASKVQVYDAFVKGAKEGFKIVTDIAPTLVGLMVAVGVIRASGTLDYIGDFLSPIGEFLSIPAQVIPVIIVRLFSASAANGLVLDLFKEYGPDSHIGLLASIIMSCTETVFYTMSVYYMWVKVKKTRYTLSGALVATFAGIAASVLVTSFF